MRLYTPEQASEYLGPEIVPPSWLRERARRREIGFVKIAGKYAFTEDHLTEIVRQFEVTPDSAARPATPRRRPVQGTGSAVTTLRARRPKRQRAS